MINKSYVIYAGSKCLIVLLENRKQGIICSVASWKMANCAEVVSALYISLLPTVPSH
jgi:hypothetical protein